MGRPMANNSADTISASRNVSQNACQSMDMVLRSFLSPSLRFAGQPRRPSPHESRRRWHSKSFGHLSISLIMQS
jgi:hypothetical protein